MKLFKHEINRKGSASWLLCNDNSKADWFRNKFIQENGGIFTKNGRNWEWSEDAPKPQKRKYESKKRWYFTNAENEQVIIENLIDFCRENKLSRAAMYEVIGGQRGQHKGYRFIKTEEIQVSDENPA